LFQSALNSRLLVIREKAKVQLGSKFDIREFHHAVLKNGEMSLSLLEKQIDKYIAENK